MHDVVVILIKAVVAGSLVVLLALLGHALRPKWFAGLFGAAPSIAIAGLAVTVIDKGHAAASDAGYGMLLGVPGFVVFCLLVHHLLHRFHALVASSLGLVAWAAVSVLMYGLVVR